MRTLGLETALPGTEGLTSDSRQRRGFHTTTNGALSSSSRQTPSVASGSASGASFTSLTASTNDSENFPEGVLLCGKYRVIRKVGQGAISGIWLVKHNVLQIDRALKRIPANLAVDPRIRARLERKARIMALADHPATVSVHDCGVSDGAPYMEMECVQGRNYEELLASGRPLSPHEVGWMLAQLCDLLEQVHAQGIVHRDLKTNKLVLQDWKRPGHDLKVLGFGMALTSGDPSLEDNDLLFIGTPAFASPEQIVSGIGRAQGDPVDSLEKVDARADIYSVGVVLYKALTGVLPYRGGLDSILLQKINKKPPAFDPSLRTEIPLELEHLVLRCLHRDPAKRPQTVLELWDEFEKAINSTSGLVVPVQEVLFYGGVPDEPNSAQDEAPSYSIDEAALVLGVPADELGRLAMRGEFGAFLQADQWRIPVEKVDGVVAEAFKDKPNFQDYEYDRLTEEIKKDPFNPQFYRRRGDIALKHRGYDRAIADYTKLIRLDLRNHEAFKKRAFAYRHLGEFDRAIQDYSAALNLSPRDSSCYLSRGFSHHCRGDFDRAISDYTRAVELDPHESSAYYNRGLAFRARGQGDLAIQDYTKVIELSPKDTSAYINRGFAYRLKGDLDRSIADYISAIAVDPRNPVAYLNRGIAHISRGDYDQATDDLSKAIELDPGTASGYYNRGFARICQEAFSHAIEDLNRAISLAPNDPSIYYNRAYAHHAQNRYQHAVQDYTRAIQLGGRDASAFYNRGVAFRDQGDHQQALIDFTQAIRLSPNDSQAILSRGISHQALDEHDLAVADFSEAIRLDRDDPGPYIHRGQSHLARKEMVQAIADFSVAIRLDPRISIAYRKRALAYLRCKRKFWFAWDLIRSFFGRRTHEKAPRRLRLAQIRLPEGVIFPATPRG